MIYTIANDFLRVSLDRHARLVELTNLHTNRNYAGGREIWHIFVKYNDDLEADISTQKCVPSITQVDAASLKLEYECLYIKDRKVDCELLIDMKLCDDEIICDLEIKNHDSAIVVREVQFPIVGNLQIDGSYRFIWSKFGGEKFDDIRSEIKKYHTQYMACDQNGIQMASLYPGTLAALNCFIFSCENEGLYFGSHDLSFQNTLHLLKLRNDNELSACFVKYPYAAAGRNVSIKGYVISPYSGTWHFAAKKYRRWLESWVEHQDVPDWVRKMNGWQRIILKHQYGKIHYTYDDFTRIYNDGAKAGIDCLLIFGWTGSGHDNDYPVYECDIKQGGQEKFKQAISQFRELYGHAILYFNGRLIDTGTDFFKSKGREICVKDENGYYALEQYPFSGNGTASRWFGNKTFAIACPVSEAWRGVLEDCVEKSIAIGADAVFFDQLGISEKICHGKSHGHESPCTNPTFHKARTLKFLRGIVKKHDSEMAIGIEALSDITAQYADFVHGLTGGCTLSENGKSVGFLDLFRYVFPSIIVSDREIRDDTDIERRLNHAVLKGLRSDVEIYRCRKTIAETPHYAAYLSKINSFRQKYAKFLLEGTYCDTENFIISGSESIDARFFKKENQCAVVMTQNSEEEVSADLCVPDYYYLQSDAIGEVKIKQIGKSELAVTLKKNSLVIAMFERKSAVIE